MHNVNYKRKIRICHQQKCVENLRHIIEATDAKVVATSDWKYIMSFMELLDTWKARNLPASCLVPHLTVVCIAETKLTNGCLDATMKR